MAQQLPLLDNRTARARARRTRAYAVTPDRPGQLLEIPAADWHIDARTKEVGLAGVAAARRALADAVRRTAA